MSSKDVLKLIKDKQVEFVDLRFTDQKVNFNILQWTQQ